MFNYFYYFIILVQKFSSLTLFGINFFNSLIQTQYFENIKLINYLRISAGQLPIGRPQTVIFPDHVMSFDQ